MILKRVGGRKAVFNGENSDKIIVDCFGFCEHWFVALKKLRIIGVVLTEIYVSDKGNYHRWLMIHIEVIFNNVLGKVYCHLRTFSEPCTVIFHFQLNNIQIFCIYILQCLDCKSNKTIFEIFHFTREGGWSLVMIKGICWKNSGKVFQATAIISQVGNVLEIAYAFGFFGFANVIGDGLESIGLGVNGFNSNGFRILHFDNYSKYNEFLSGCYIARFDRPSQVEVAA